MPNDRIRRLIATARKHPEFAARLLQDLPEAARAEVVTELAKPSSPLPRPGLRKCGPRSPRSRHGAHSGMTAQLNVFAKRVSRVS